MSLKAFLFYYNLMIFNIKRIKRTNTVPAKL